MRFALSLIIALPFTFVACATGSELPNSTGGASSLSSSSGASSSSSSSSVSSSSSGGGEGASGGAGGAGGEGGMGGASVSASSSASSASSSSGGMGGGGMGGGGGGSTGTLVAVAGPSAGGAYFEPGTGWTTAPFNLSFHSAEIAPRMAGGALAVYRRSSGVADENNELYWTNWTKASGFGTPAKVGVFGFAKDGPATAAAGVASVITFLGTDNKHYFSQNADGISFGPFGPVPAGMVQNQAFGPSATKLANDGVAGVYAVYAGDDSRLYYSYKISPGGAWGPSTQAPTSLVVNAMRPFAFVDAEMDLRIIYVRQTDNRICMVKLVTPQNTWTAEEPIATAATAHEPAAAEVAPGGDIVIAYHGLLNEGIYFVRGKDGAFGGITAVEVPLGPSSAPVVTRGLSGADAEIVYATGGKLRHARVNGNAAVVSDVPGLANVADVSATLVP